MSTKNINYPLNHYKSTYGINKNGAELRKLVEKDYGMRQYYIFKRSCEIAVNSFVGYHTKWFDGEIDAEQNEQLLKDITTNLIIQVR